MSQTESNLDIQFQVFFFNLFKVSNWFKIRSLELWPILKLSFCYVLESQNWLMTVRLQWDKSQWLKLGLQKEPDKLQDSEDKFSVEMELHMKIMSWKPLLIWKPSIPTKEPMISILWLLVDNLQDYLLSNDKETHYVSLLNHLFDFYIWSFIISKTINKFNEKKWSKISVWFKKYFWIAKG